MLAPSCVPRRRTSSTPALSCLLYISRFSSSSVAGRTALQRFDFPVVDKGSAVGPLHLHGHGRIGAPLPAQIRDLVHRPDERRRLAMAIEAETHAERFGVRNLVHPVNTPVAGYATDAASDVNRVVEINVIGHDVNLHPRDGFAGRRAGAN